MTDEQGFEQEPLRQRLLLCGITEIATHGVADFSLRRVAATCGTSCAAPYRHFKNKEELILEIVRYIHRQWSLMREEVLRLFTDDPKKQLVEVAISYIRFFASHPHYRTVLTAAGERDSIAPDMARLFDAAAVGIPPEDRERRYLTLRALLYGAAAMLESGELANDPATYARIRRALEDQLVPPSPPPER